MARLSSHFVAPLYTMIFEKDLPCTSQETMEALVIIVDWYASPDRTFIRMYNTKKALHLLLKFSADKMVM